LIVDHGTCLPFLLHGIIIEWLSNIFHHVTL
jgi:hypothetical protein